MVIDKFDDESIKDFFEEVEDLSEFLASDAPEWEEPLWRDKKKPN